ncbi:hypothetical protein DPMN_190869 [Dreissena polymorpha]|uniref:Uncharacterized protein n=1 Tax=Dreissena polymorpha TaxID=45954 RepID=A0A9D4BD73_DREPO|nr:hypothetical protein DPMN_190869 [Dreissena polymorpha]
MKFGETAPHPGGNVFQRTKTIFKLSLSIIRTNVRTKFHEDLTINETPRMLTRTTALPPCGHFHEDWTINVTSRVLTRKTAPPPGGHVFSTDRNHFKLSLAIIITNVLTNVTPSVFTTLTAPPLLAITNVLTKFHEDWTKNKTSRVLIRFYYSQ